MKVLKYSNFSFDAFNIIVINFLMHFDFIIISQLINFKYLFFSMSILVQLISFKHKLIIFIFRILVFQNMKLISVIFFFSKLISNLAHIVCIFGLILWCFIIRLLRKWYFFSRFFIFRCSQVNFFHIFLSNFFFIKFIKVNNYFFFIEFLFIF